MTAMRVTRQALSLPVFPGVLWAEAALAADLCRLANEAIAAVCTAHPDRFVGLAALPVHDPKPAVAEFRRAVKELGFRGAMIPTNANGRDLDSPDLRPILAEAQDLDVVLVVHPVNPIGRDRMRDYHLVNYIGFPAESALAIARLVVSGTLAELPRLKLCFTHGGGSYAYGRGRVERAHATFPEAKVKVQGDLRPFWRRFYVDTIVHGSEAVEFLVNAHGADRTVIGTDYPYAMGDADPVTTVEDIASIDDEDRQRILDENAAALLGLA
jgi:aminocarboxymuconate-semialdehyde decarboxylase